MRLGDFASRYKLHDSFIESVSYDQAAHIVMLRINFAFWMQADYKEGLLKPEY